MARQMCSWRKGSSDPKSEEAVSERSGCSKAENGRREMGTEAGKEKQACELRVFLLLLLLMLLLCGNYASAQNRGSDARAEDLLSDCTADKKSSPDALLFCLHYLVGFVDGALVAQPEQPASKILCYPDEGVSTEQVRRIVVKWLESHPQNLHTSARIQVMLALHDAFPCKEPSPR